MRISAPATARRWTDAPFTPPSGIPRSEHNRAMRTDVLLEAGSGTWGGAGFGEQPGQCEGGATLIEPRFGAPAGRDAHAGAAAWGLEQRGNGVGERLCIAGLDDASGDAVADDLGHAGDARSDRGQAARGGLEQHGGERVLVPVLLDDTRQRHERGALHDAADLRLRERTREADVTAELQLFGTGEHTRVLFAVA